MVIMMITFVIQITINMININGDDHDDEERYDDDHVDRCAINKGWHWEGLMIIMIMITNPWLIWCSLWWWWWLWDQEGLTGGRPRMRPDYFLSLTLGLIHTRTILLWWTSLFCDEHCQDDSDDAGDDVVTNVQWTLFMIVMWLQYHIMIHPSGDDEIHMIIPHENYEMMIIGDELQSALKITCACISHKLDTTTFTSLKQNIKWNSHKH